MLSTKKRVSEIEKKKKSKRRSPPSDNIIFRMRCIYSQSPGLPSLPRLKHKHQFTTPKQLSRPFPLATRSKPITTVSLVLGFNSGLGFDSPANTGDLSVLIPTSALLFFAYWVTNFVVPDIISRHLGLDKTGESDESNANNSFDDEKKR